MKKDRIFWGVLFILAAFAVIGSKFGLLLGINTFTILLTVFIIASLIKSIIHRSIYGTVMFLAVLLILYARPLGITAITPFTILLAAWLFSLGLSMIFGHRHHHNFSGHNSYNTVENVNGSQIDISCNYGGSVKYLNSEDFKHANIDANFSGLKIYFDNATITGDSASLDIRASFAGVELFIPKSWRIDNQLHTNIGGVDEKNNAIPNSSSPTLIITGTISFSGITIIHC